jgi:hypothetical protein
LLKEIYPISRTRRNGICVEIKQETRRAGGPKNPLKMRSKQILALLAISVWLGSCNSSRVVTDADPSANLGRYHTYRFADSDDNQAGQNPLYHSSIIDNSIHAQIAIELEKRGYQESPHQADMIIMYHTYTERKQSSSNNYYPMMYGGWGWRYYPFGMAPYAYPYSYWNGYNRTYTEGTLIIDVIDANSNQVIWRGSISDVVDEPKNLHKKAMKAVSIIFSRFPLKSAPPKVLAKQK